jgi:hypothetical protein
MDSPKAATSIGRFLLTASPIRVTMLPINNVRVLDRPRLKITLMGLPPSTSSTTICHLIPSRTGVSEPYDEPLHPEVAFGSWMEGPEKAALRCGSCWSCWGWRRLHSDSLTWRNRWRFLSDQRKGLHRHRAHTAAHRDQNRAAAWNKSA